MHQTRGMRDGAATVGDRQLLSHKAEHVRTMWSSSCAPRYLSKGMKTSLYPKTCTWMLTAVLPIIDKSCKRTQDALW